MVVTIFIVLTFLNFALSLGETNSLEEKLIENNNGVQAPPGYHSHLVAFMKKPDFQVDKKIADMTPTDFSLKGPFFCSGTILNRRWALTRATPIAYYPIGSYWMVSQRTIISPVDVELTNTHEVDFVWIHPDHTQGDISTDLALVRTTHPLFFGFDTRNVNLGFAEPRPFQNCKLVLWGWFASSDKERKFNTMIRSELSFDINKEHCTKVGEAYDEYFMCLSQESGTKKPCAVNSGAPVLCDSVLAGVYVGGAKGAVCTDNITLKGYNALRVNNGSVLKWIRNALSAHVFTTFYEEQDVENAKAMRQVVLKVCGSGTNGGLHLPFASLLISLCFINWCK